MTIFKFLFFSVTWIKEIVVPISENYLKEAQQVCTAGHCSSFVPVCDDVSKKACFLGKSEVPLAGVFVLIGVPLRLEPNETVVLIFEFFSVKKQETNNYMVFTRVRVFVDFL